MTNIKIIVCCHKKDICYNKEPYFPIQVGKANANVNLGIQGDDTGDNISIKNTSYCELTGMYWAWKNLKGVDYIGLCHYRRYFDFHNQCQKLIPTTEFCSDSMGTLDFSVPESYLEKIKKGKIIVPAQLHYPQTLMQDYMRNHVSDDFRVLSKIMDETQSEAIKRSFDKVVKNGNKLIRFNMFLMSWTDFDAYCTWIFDLLKKVEDNTDISNYNSVQRRIYGYMSERLFNVWIDAYHPNKVELPVMFFVDNPRRKRNSVLWKMREFIWDSVNKINHLSRSLSNGKD